MLDAHAWFVDAPDRSATWLVRQFRPGGKLEALLAPGAALPSEPHGRVARWIRCDWLDGDDLRVDQPQTRDEITIANAVHWAEMAGHDRWVIEQSLIYMQSLFLLRYEFNITNREARKGADNALTERALDLVVQLQALAVDDRYCLVVREALASCQLDTRLTDEQGHGWLRLPHHAAA
jgi:hypothetical protein